MSARAALTLIGAMVGAIVTLAPGALGAERVGIEHLLHGGQGEAVRLATEEAAALFNSIQDDIEVEVTLSGGNAQAYLSLLVTRTAGGIPPDVITSNRLGEVAGRDLALPLNAYIRRDGVDRVLHPALIDLNTWNGNVISLPLFTQPFVTFYNPRLFAESGVPTPNEAFARGAWDWGALSDAARRIARDESGDGDLDVWGMGTAAHNMPRSVLWLKQGGGYFFDHYSNPQESRMQGEGVATALRYLHSLVHEINVAPVHAVVSGAATGGFNEGWVGMLWEGPWRISDMRTRGIPDDLWEMAPMPAGPGGRPTFIHSDGAQIMQASPNPEAAWAWIRFLATDPGAIGIFVRVTGQPPAAIGSSTALAEYMAQLVRDGRPVTASVLEQTLIAAGDEAFPIIPIVPNFEEMNRVYQAEVRAYLQGEKDLAAATAAIDHHFSQVLQASRR